MPGQRDDRAGFAAGGPKTQYPKFGGSTNPRGMGDQELYSALSARRDRHRFARSTAPAAGHAIPISLHGMAISTCQLLRVSFTALAHLASYFTSRVRLSHWVLFTFRM